MTNEHKDLPALPGPQFRHHGVAGKVDYFTANQMRAIQAESYDIGYSAALAARPEPAGAGVDCTASSIELAVMILSDCGHACSSPSTDRLALRIASRIDAHVAAQVAKVQAASQAQQPVASVASVDDAHWTNSRCEYEVCDEAENHDPKCVTWKDDSSAPASDGGATLTTSAATAPDAGARDAALEEATNQAIYKLIEEHFNYGTVYGEEAARYYAVGHEIAEFACAVLALNPAPAKPAQDLGMAEQNEDELATLSNELLALKHSYLQLELKLGVTEHLLATLRATIASQDSLIKHLTNAVDYHKKRAK